MRGGVPVVCEALWNWVSTLQYGFLKGLWTPPVLQVLSCFQGLPGALLCSVFCPCLVYFSGSRVRIGVVGSSSGAQVRNHPGCLQTSLLKMHFWKSRGAAWVGHGKSTCRSGWDFGLGAGTFLHLLHCLPLSAVTEQWKKARLSGLYFSCVWGGRKTCWCHTGWLCLSNTAWAISLLGTDQVMYELQGSGSHLNRTPYSVLFLR